MRNKTISKALIWPLFCSLKQTFAISLITFFFTCQNILFFEIVQWSILLLQMGCSFNSCCDSTFLSRKQWRAEVHKIVCWRAKTFLLLEWFLNLKGATKITKLIIFSFKFLKNKTICTRLLLLHYTAKPCREETKQKIVWYIPFGRFFTIFWISNLGRTASMLWFFKSRQATKKNC